MNKTIAKPISQVTPTVHHYARTFFAAIFGTLALSLVLVSILVVWANSILTNTDSYVAAVGPLITKPIVRDFIAQKASDNLIKQAPTQDLAKMLLGDAEIMGKTDEQLKISLAPVIKSNIIEVVSTSNFAELWTSTNRSAHSQLLAQIKAHKPDLTLDMSASVKAAIAELKKTKLSQISDKIGLPEGAGKLNLSGSKIQLAEHYYDLLQTGTISVVLLMIFLAGLSILLSVHHMKTLRHILYGSGLIALFMASALKAPAVVDLKTGDPGMQQLIATVVGTVFHQLQQATLFIGLACIVLAIASKVFESMAKNKKLAIK